MSEPVTFTQALLPIGNWLPVCERCGAVVLNSYRHIEWHLDLDGDDA